jgi:hypothetical protein
MRATFSNLAKARLAARRDAVVVCSGCGKRVPRKARRQRFCSRKCRQRAHYAKLVGEGGFNPLLGRDSGRPTHPLRSPLNGKGFSERKLGPTVGISGPFAVIAARDRGDHLQDCHQTENTHAIFPNRSKLRNGAQKRISDFSQPCNAVAVPA